MPSQTGAVESTHGPPTQSERNALADDRVRIADVKAKILELEHALSSLREEKELLQGRLDAYTYPVLTLPNEIAAETVYPQTPPFIGRSFPSVLGQICSKWREIV
ncbi:hypothetical protein C8F04DRAFT_1240177 [Mycena alexandri]|uniref:Uncharacterized protein n=1 Tax=Mycena alexandri TaxID=1745969 RepID=A0AAD6WSA3_9AGAR|nr:hypothetical protein C8F04DRAFT_1240177 [Mycena alexandri]